MKRAGFTMIELIFVIVILGILASVAVPKLLGVKNSAEEGLFKSFVGSLNTTVAPAKWSQSLMDDNNGSIKVGTTYDITSADTDFPKGVTTTVTTANCATSSATTAALIATSGTVGTKTFYVVCRDGNTSNAPKFWYTATNPTTTAATFDDSKLKL